MNDKPKCELCGEPMPEGEEVFKYHGYSGPCPKSPLPSQEEPWVAESLDELVRDLCSVVPRSKSEVRRRLTNLLEADRKERAGVMLRELPSFEAETAGGKQTVVLKDDLEDLLSRM